MQALAALIFALALIHTFAASRLTRVAAGVQRRHEDAARRRGRAASPSVAAELLHLCGEVEVVFGAWALVLLVAIAAHRGWETARHYVSDTVVYTEAIFVVVVMALASTRPVIQLAEQGLRRLAALGGATPAAWWVVILVVGPLLGSFITEPAAMTIATSAFITSFTGLETAPELMPSMSAATLEAWHRRVQ